MNREMRNKYTMDAREGVFCSYMWFWENLYQYQVFNYTHKQHSYAGIFINKYAIIGDV